MQQEKQQTSAAAYPPARVAPAREPHQVAATAAAEGPTKVDPYMPQHLQTSCKRFGWWGCCCCQDACLFLRFPQHLRGPSGLGHQQSLLLEGPLQQRNNSGNTWYYSRPVGRFPPQHPKPEGKNGPSAGFLPPQLLSLQSVSYFHSDSASLASKYILYSNVPSSSFPPLFRRVSL